jgi:hypothetical protein
MLSRSNPEIVLLLRLDPCRTENGLYYDGNIQQNLLNCGIILLAKWENTYNLWSLL